MMSGPAQSGRCQRPSLAWSCVAGILMPRGGGGLCQRTLAGWYCSTTLAGMRPRALTARPGSLPRPDITGALAVSRGPPGPTRWCPPRCGPPSGALGPLACGAGMLDDDVSVEGAAVASARGRSGQ